ncbi:hypothetical protein [Methanolobus profundi]|uniref:Uncharacterized protein n=1 Tax=Methanolobus profundi TaxID=487685 RepID=A0A1I4PQ57_9EURY|nr:hypothetical protein [Methanolobus profundi]SFM29917.1 hypothetical protein SAMN04488696_0823 [Methanolobus profundi]
MIKLLHDKIDKLTESKSTEGFLQTILIIMGLFLAVFVSPENLNSRIIFSYSFAVFIVSSLFLYSNFLSPIFSFLMGGSFSLIFIIYIVPEGLFTLQSSAENMGVYLLFYFALSTSIILFILKKDEYIKKNVPLVPLSILLTFISFMYFYSISNPGTKFEIKNWVLYISALIDFAALISICLYHDREKVTINTYAYPIMLTVGSLVLCVFFIYGLILGPEVP